MTFQPNQNLYGVAIGSTNGQGPSYPHYDVRAPTSTDILYLLGQQWVWPNNGIWFLLGLSSAGGTTTATWEQVVSSTGDVLSVTGTANQITASPTTGNVVVSLPAAITTPGSLTTTTSLAATTTVTAGTGVTATTGNITASAGSVNAGTSITATLGNITATNGNLVLGTAGNKLSIATGVNASVGVTGAMSGSPGSVSVSSTAVTTSSVILFSRATTGGTPGQVSISSQTTGSFTLLSTGNETSTFNYLIIN